MVANLAYENPQRHLENIDRAAKVRMKHRLRLELELAGIPQKALAIGARIDEGQLSRMLSDRNEEALPAHKFPVITQELGPGLMEWLAIQCGGLYSHGAEGPLIEGPLATLVGKLAHQTGEVVQQLIFVMESKHINIDEQKDVIAALRGMAQTTQALLNTTEGRLA